MQVQAQEKNATRLSEDDPDVKKAVTMTTMAAPPEANLLDRRVLLRLVPRKEISCSIPLLHSTTQRASTEKKRANSKSQPQQESE